MRPSRLAAAFAALSVCHAAAAIEAQPDLTWEPQDGNRHYDLGGPNDVSRAYDARMEGSNYVVLEARGPAAGARQFHLVTINPLGAVISDFDTGVLAHPSAPAILIPGGGALLGGTIFVGDRSAPTVRKVFADGSTDLAFGELPGTGTAYLPFPGDRLDLTSLHIDAQGRITMGGYAVDTQTVQLPFRSWVGRLTPNGLPQPGFGSNGLAFWQMDPANGTDFVRAVLGHSSGLVYGCGDADFVGSKYATLVQFNAQGVQNMSYAGGGMVFYTADTPQENRTTFCSEVGEQPNSARVVMQIEWRFGGGPTGAVRAFPLPVSGNPPANQPDLLPTTGFPSGVKLGFDALSNILVAASHGVSGNQKLFMARANGVGDPTSDFSPVGQIALDFVDPPFIGVHKDTEAAVAVFPDRGRIVGVANYNDTVANDGFVIYRLQGYVPFRDGFE